MGRFFPQGSQSMFRSSNPLIQVVRPLPTNARKAMYAAAEKGLIRRGTWDGCAWNAAGVQVGRHDVKSFDAAGEVFGCSPELVRRFIQKWDGLHGSDEWATDLLKDAIEAVGINSPANRGAKIISGYAYKSLDTQFKEQLAEIDSIEDIPGLTGDMVEHAMQMLDTCSV